MASKKNRDIRSFFSKSQAAKPSASRTRISQTPTPAPEPSPQSNNGGPYSQSPSPLPEVPSSPPDITSHDPDPEPPSRALLSCYAVIAASDDEEDPDSDEDLFPELGFIGGPRNAAPRALPAPKNPPAPARWNPCVTPRSKRTTTAPDFLSSPLTIQSKKKKHDMKSLLEFTRKDAETRASAQRFSALLEGEAEMQREDGGFVDEEKEESSAAGALKEHILESAVAAGGDEGDEEEGGPDRMRIVRALERTELGGDSRRYYFFEHKEPEVKVVGRKFPKDKAKGAWAVLGGAQDRARHFASGFPYNIQKKLGNIPDEIFLWVLDEVCSEQRIPLQVEYRKLLSICHDQTQRLVTPTLLQQLFRNLGATEDVSELMAPITLREEASNPYPNRDWSCVENFLELLGQMSDHFTSATRSTAMQMLLRLGMDNIAVEGFGYAQKWREAAGLIAHSVPDEQWISFCQEICSSLSESTQKATMRWRAIALLGPAVTPGSNTFSTYLQTRTLDLKRRLASVFFFGDLQRADTEPEDTVHIRAIIDRLEDDEFQINQYTDYQELGALMMMLNVALGDISKKMEVTEPSITSFDAEVDELAEGLKSMLTRVAPLNKGIHVSRIEAKNAMELIRERLLYQVRIKSVPKVGIFGKRGEEDSSVPRQRDFMKGFLLKKGRESSVRAESDVVKTEPAIKVEVDAAMAG